MSRTSRLHAFGPTTLALALVAGLALAGCGDDPDVGVTGDASATAGGDTSHLGEINESDATGTEVTGGDVAGGDVAGSDVAGTDTNGSDTTGTDTSAVDPDGATTDATVSADSGDAGGAPCPGGEGCECAANGDCDNGICLDTADGKVCAKKCVETCEKGFSCKSYGASDSVFVCVPTMTSLCSPCESDNECVVENNGALCLDYGTMGKFCGGSCKADDDCPTNYGCADVADKATGKLAKQCKLKKVVKAGSGGACTADNACQAGESCEDGKCAVVEQPMCTCSKWATAFGKKTTCSNTNSAGTCSGVRTCTEKGMGDCTAAVPAVETCNDLDDDCDGKIDALPASVTCTVATYLDQGSKKACKSDSECSGDEGCDAADGKCKVLIGACPGKPKCATGGVMLCTDAKQPKQESCNGDDDNCDGTVDEGFEWTDPVTNGALGIGAICGSGACAGGKVVCETLLQAVCSTATKITKETCDGADNDCDGDTDEESCDDGDACTSDSCDGKTCENKAGAACDDGNACTTDSCDAKTGKCVYLFYTGSCDDNNACTVGDACAEATGKEPFCLPGATTKVCDDNNLCTDDSCEADKGCVTLANAATKTCFDADAKVVGVGLCKAGLQYCTNGALDTTCVGQVLPNKIEACDGKDDDCDGTTDEGCQAKSAEIFVSNTSGAVKDAKGKGLYLHIGGDGPRGVSKGSKQTFWSGFVAWLSGLSG